jgi:enterochelin esterase-like enzyme
MAKIPWALWGHSGGGIWSDVMAALHPDRIVAVWMHSCSALMFLTHPEFVRPDVPAAVYAIPMMTNPRHKGKTEARSE